MTDPFYPFYVKNQEAVEKGALVSVKGLLG